MKALAAAEENFAVIQSGAGDGSFFGTATIAATLHARRGDAPAALSALGEVVRWGLDNAHRWPIFYAVIAGVSVMADLDRPDCAAVLTGICEGNLREQFPLPPYTAANYDAKVSQVRRQLGADPFDAAFRRGATMTDDSAVHYLLDEIERPQTEPPTPQ